MRFGIRPALRAGLLALALGWSAAAIAQPFPSRPITLVVPFTPGGSNDVVARFFAPVLKELVGQPVIVENRGGSGGSLGATYVARSKPDGHTLLLSTNPPLTISKLTSAKLAYDPEKDFQPIALLGNTLIVLVANPELPANTFGELIKYVRDRPGKVSIGFTNSQSQVLIEAINKRAGISLIPVPYQSGAAPLRDVIGGHIELALTSFASSLPLVETKSLKMIALAEPRRHSEMPNLPAIDETVPDVSMLTWFGLLAPAGTPKENIELIHKATKDVLATSDMQTRFRNNGLVMIGTGPQQLGDQITHDLAKFKAMLSETGITLQGP